MTPYQFLVEELQNVRRLLSETLRHDYGPDHSGPYYQECDLRLKHIERLINGADRNDRIEISSIYAELRSVGWRIALIERAHLGEFSWPFANEIRRIANLLLYDKTLAAKSSPIIHVVAESHGYRILNEGSFKHSPGRSRIAVVEFPRTLKHQVLFHSLFGHEICHTGFSIPAFIGKLTTQVLQHILDQSPLKNVAAATAWINDPGAPPEVKAALSNFAKDYGVYRFTEQHRFNWVTELMCDMFGLILFGPAFLAAHNALLTALSPEAYDVDLIDQSHPPYEIRNKMLIQCMRLLDWHTPSIRAAEQPYHLAEANLLQHLCSDNSSSWDKLFDDADLMRGLEGIQRMLLADGVQGYQKIGGLPLKQLLDKLARKLPPIIDTIDDNGKPDLISLDVAAILYAGWIFAEQGGLLTNGANPDFFDANRLCEQALLQREAIVLKQKA